MKRAEVFSDYVMCPCRDVSCNALVTPDQEQKEELLYEIFDEEGDNALAEW